MVLKKKMEADALVVLSVRMPIGVGLKTKLDSGRPVSVADL